MPKREKECIICGKKELSLFNEDYYFFRKITPIFLKDLLLKKGYRYNSKFYICYNCNCRGKRLRFKQKCYKNCKHFKKILQEQANKGYIESIRLPCSGCPKGYERMKLILKKKTFIINEDFLDIPFDDLDLKIYWFTIEVVCRYGGRTFIFDRKNRNLIVDKKLRDNIMNECDVSYFSRKIMTRIWESIDKGYYEPKA